MCLRQGGKVNRLMFAGSDPAAVNRRHGDRCSNHQAIGQDVLSLSDPAFRLVHVGQEHVGGCEMSRDKRRHFWLRVLEGVESDEPEVAALIAGHLATAYMLLPDMDEAERWVAEAQHILPDSLMVRATVAMAAIHRGRIASSEHQTVDFAALTQAHDDALEIRDELKAARRYEESVRLLMLAADALTVVKESKRARALIRSATDEERAVEDAREVLGDAALRAQGWDEALALTDNTHETEAVKRIRASAGLASGNLYEQNRALVTLDNIIAERGREAPQAALSRLASTFGSRRAEWSNDAFDALREAGYEEAALTARA